MPVKLLLILLISGYCKFIHAQVPLTGKVINEKNEPLAGVSVKIVNGGGTSTNAEGRYSIILLPGKKYQLEFSAVSYITRTISDVEVLSGIDNELDLVMEPAVKNIESVVVKSTTRRQESTNALLSFQKNNIAVSSGIAADFIKRTPDKNTGEVLKRVSGTSVQENKFVIIRGLADRYNAAYINAAQLPSSEPDRKAFSFDVIPSQLIDNIVINKTATPNYTGEFAGGLVMVTTKDIPNRKALIIGVGLGFNTQASFRDFVSNPRGSTDWLGFSRRKLPSSWPRDYKFYNSLSQDDKLSLAKQLPGDVYRRQSGNTGPIQSWQLTWANVVKDNKGGAWGSILGFTYRHSKLVYSGANAVTRSFPPDVFEYSDHQNRYSSNLGVIANVAYTKGRHKIAFKNLFNQLLDDNYYERSGFTEHNPMQLYSSALNQRSLYSSQFEGTHGWGRLKMEWNVNYSYNNRQQPDMRVVSYAVSPGNPNERTLNNRGNNTNRFFSNLNDHAFGGVFSLSIPFNLFQRNQSLKLGASTNIRFRNFRAVILGIEDPADKGLLSLPVDEIFNHENFRPDGFVYSTALQNPSDRYQGISALSAGYFMFDSRLSEKIRMVWGLRAENFEQFIKSNDARKGDTAVTILTRKPDLLPSMNLTISTNDKTNLRFSVSKTVARPEFREMAPFAFYDFEQLASVAGNPSLKRSRIYNLDLRYEFYPRPGELVSLGTFYKHFNNPIELRLDDGSVPSRRQYIFQNGEEARLLGAEFEIRKGLAFLDESSKWLKNIFFNANLTYTFSKVSLQAKSGNGDHDVSSSRPLQGQSPYLVNAGLQYDGNRIGASVLYNRIGPRLSLVGNSSMADIYENARDLFDIQFTTKLFEKKGELRLTVSDLMNQKILLYQNINKKKTFNNDDWEFSSFRPGTTVTLSFHYNLDL